MAFDARAAKLLQPGEYLLIGDCPGLRLTASEERRSWAYRYKSPVDGKMRQVQIGRWPVMSPPAAMIAWEALRSRRDTGEDPALAKKQAKAAVVTKKKDEAYTVRRLCDDYLAGHVDVHRGESSRKEMRRLMSKHLDAIADRSAQSITRSDAFDLLESMASTPVSAQTLRGELGAAWDYALDAGRIPDSVPNWWRLVMRGRLKSKGKSRGGVKIGTIKRVLSQTEIGTLLRWMPKLTPLLSDTLTLYLWTAVRGVEIMAMEKAEILEEQDGWWWTIPKHKTKNARHENATDLRVPLVGRAYEIVHRRMALYEGYLFPASTKLGHSKQQIIGAQVARRMSYNTVQLERNWEKMPVDGWTPHDLRRTSRTILASLGCPDEVAEAILGHMQPGIKGIYNIHGYDKERREWLTLLAAKYESL